MYGPGLTGREYAAFAAIAPVVPLVVNPRLYFAPANCPTVRLDVPAVTDVPSFTVNVVLVCDTMRRDAGIPVPVTSRPDSCIGYVPEAMVIVALPAVRVELNTVSAPVVPPATVD